VFRTGLKLIVITLSILMIFHLNNPAYYGISESGIQQVGHKSFSSIHIFTSETQTYTEIFPDENSRIPGKISKEADNPIYGPNGDGLIYVIDSDIRRSRAKDDKGALGADYGHPAVTPPASSISAPAPVNTPANTNTPAPAHTATLTQAPAHSPTTIPINDFAARVAALVDMEREKVGLQPLIADDALMAAAQYKCRDMNDNDYYAHDSPTYGDPVQLMDMFNVAWRAFGENIAAGHNSPEEVVEAWMNSEGHRKNILNPDYSRIGIGYLQSGGTHSTYWVQLFAG